MMLAFDLQDLPGDAITILLFMLISFFGWLKNHLSRDREEEHESTAEDEEEAQAREVVWRRQIGDQDNRPIWETDRTVWHPETAEPPPLPTPSRSAPPQRPAAPARNLSEKEKHLAAAFEQNVGRPRSRRRHPLAKDLRRPGATRRAILLAETLGPPVALRTPDERHP
jgi:hypothetical protein